MKRTPTVPRLAPAPCVPGRAGFTFVEVMIAATMTGVLLVAALGGVVALQKSYASTEGYGTGMADQMRLLDFLAQDLRRAATSTAGANPWTVDADGQGIKISVPDYYRFNASDTQHLFPIANDPIYDPGTGAAYYSSAVSSGLAPMTSPATVLYKTVAYRYKSGLITRTDPWGPLGSDGKGGYTDPGPVVIATSMDAFPTFQFDAAGGGSALRYNITFYSTFQPLAARGGVNSTTISLHNVTFVRSKNLSR